MLSASGTRGRGRPAYLVRQRKALRKYHVLAIAEGLLEQGVHGGASVKRREGDGAAVVVLDDLVLPEKTRGSAEHRPTKDETLSNQVIEQAKRSSTELAADQHLKILMTSPSLIT
jgi:hypothetical protein